MSTMMEQYFDRLSEEKVLSIAKESRKEVICINGNEYPPRRITTREFFRHEKLRANFTSEKSDQTKAAQLLATIYFEAAKMYPRMTVEEYFAAP